MTKIKKLIFPIFKWITIIALYTYLGLIVLLLSKENNMLYWGQAGKALMNHEIPGSFKEDLIQTSLGKIEVYKKIGEANLPIILYFGGNGEHANLSLDWLDKEFINNTTYSFNYPNYGKSEGLVGQKNIEAMFLEASRKLLNDKPVVLVGRSLGTGFSTYVASNIDNVKALILITPYSKITEIACGRFIYVPSFICKTFMENKMDNTVFIKDTKIPVLIVYAQGDTTIPNENTKELIALNKNIKTVEVVGTNHNSVMNHSLTQKSVIDFMKNIN